MTMAGGASFLIAGAACALTNAQSVDLPGAEVRVSDVVSLECVTPSHRRGIGELAIASANRDSEVTRLALAALVRRRVPALGVNLGGDPAATIRLRAPHRAPVGAFECYSARRAISAGEAISADDVERAPCSADVSVRAPVRYEAMHGLMRAAEDIAAGQLLGRMMGPPHPITETGRQMTLTIAIGPVTIERSVETVQPSRGGAIFVRNEDGHVFSAPMNAQGAP
jgi:hypothetical protein